MATKIDLNKLNKEIALRKTGQSELAEKLGEPMREQVTSRSVLQNLIKARETHTETNTTIVIKEVVNKAAIIKGEKPVISINKSDDGLGKAIVTPPTRNVSPKVNDSMERDANFFNDMKKMNQHNIGVKNVSSDGGISPNIENTQKSGGLYDEVIRKEKEYNNLGSNYQTQQPINEIQQRTGGNINANAIKDIVNEQMVDTFNILAEEQMKATIIELYTKEKIKEVLMENHELLKKMVIEVIRDLKTPKK